MLFLSDIFPTGYMAAENAEIEKGDTVAVWGCGPVGQFAIQSAWMFGAGRVIAIDRVPERLRMAQEKGKAETINFEKEGRLRSPDGDDQGPRSGPLHRRRRSRSARRLARVDAVLDKAKMAVMLETDRPHVLREAIMCCRKGGTVSVPGVYIGVRRQDSVRGIHEQRA